MEFLFTKAYIYNTINRKIIIDGLVKINRKIIIDGLVKSRIWQICHFDRREKS